MMVFKFQTSLSSDEFKDILRHRANSKNIEITSNHNRLILNNLKIRMSSIAYMPFVTKTAFKATITTVKGYIALPKIVCISTLTAYLIFACGIIGFKNNETSIFIPLIVLFITALCIIGFIRMVLYPYFNYLLQNSEVMKLLESIETDYPVEVQLIKRDVLS